MVLGKLKRIFGSKETVRIISSSQLPPEYEATHGMQEEMEVKIAYLGKDGDGYHQYKLVISAGDKIAIRNPKIALKRAEDITPDPKNDYMPETHIYRLVGQYVVGGERIKATAKIVTDSPHISMEELGSAYAAAVLAQMVTGYLESWGYSPDVDIRNKILKETYRAVSEVYGYVEKETKYTMPLRK